MPFFRYATGLYSEAWGIFLRLLVTTASGDVGRAEQGHIEAGQENQFSRRADKLARLGLKQ